MTQFRLKSAAFHTVSSAWYISILEFAENLAVKYLSIQSCVKLLYFIRMNQQEFLDKRRKKFEELKKLRVDAAYELYCSLSDEEKLISELEFARKLVKHMGMKISTARKYAGYLVLEYHVEFCKYKMRRPSYRICR